MTMLKCNNCRRVFPEDEVDYIYEYDEYWGTPFTTSIQCCPYCRDYDIEDYNESEDDSDEE